MNSRLLTGNVVDPLADELDRLRNDLLECRHAFDEMREERNRMTAERDAMANAVIGLRNLLAPLWGEIQKVGQIGMMSAPASFERSVLSPRIEAVKRSMPGKPAELINLLLVHGAMTVTQIITIARWGKNSVYQTVSKLGKAGVLVNNGGKYTLKEQ